MKTSFTLSSFILTVCVNAQIAYSDQKAPPCANPVMPFAVNITNHSALLTWEPYGDEQPVAYNIVWHEEGKRWDSVFNITDTFYQLTQLKSNTFYEFKPAAVCADTVSKYKLRWKFITLTEEGYCSAHSNSLCYIDYVRVKNKKNVSGSNGSGYGDYTNITMPLVQQKNYTVYVKPTAERQINGAVTVSVYIDFNNNKNFTDPGELIGRKVTPERNELPFNFTVPQDAVTGLTVMRIVVEETFFAYNNPCNYTNGEAEDYSVNIKNASTANDDAGMISYQRLNKINIFPNPVNSTATINFRLNKNSNIELTVVDQYGRVLKSELKKVQSGGDLKTQLSTANISDGNYFLVLKQDGNVIGRTVLVIKH
ncbi:MAG: fibronectin type III domain-containing protein [Bacteroidetes bacterium]|nr:fibronectin type III domain-containing protein [Bacteroidota bacterium]